MIYTLEFMQAYIVALPFTYALHIIHHIAQSARRQWCALEFRRSMHMAARYPHHCVSKNTLMQIHNVLFRTAKTEELKNIPQAQHILHG